MTPASNWAEYTQLSSLSSTGSSLVADPSPSSSSSFLMESLRRALSLFWLLKWEPPSLFCPIT